MVKEPQGVLELMEQTEAAWERQIAACDDATGPARTSLREDLRALRMEYAEADYPRREAIGAELRALIRRYEALGGGIHEPAAPHAPVPLGVEAGTLRHAAEPQPGRKGRTRKAAGAEVPEPAGPPHAPVPLGVETAPLPPGAAPEPRPGRRPGAPSTPWDAPHAPVPLGVEAGRTPTPVPPEPPRAAAPAPEPERAPEPPRSDPARAQAAPGPVPHGDPGPGYRQENASGGAGGGGRTEEPRPENGDGWRSVWERVRQSAFRWARVARTAVEHEVLRKKREERLMEVGVRVRQLAARDALGAAEGDGGVRERLKQVEQVDTAIRDNRERYEDLTRPGG